MSDEKSDNKPVEKDAQSSLLELRNSFAGKSGDQGVILKPVGGHDTDPFIPQDTIQPQPTSSQQDIHPTSSIQSSGSDSDSGE